MFNGLSNNDTHPAFEPDTVVTITDGQLMYRGPSSLHAFGRLTGEVVDISMNEDIERVDICIVGPSSRKILLALPLAGGQTLRTLLPLASVKRYTGHRLDFDVTPSVRNEIVRALVTIHDGSDALGWAVPKEQVPVTKEGRISLTRELVSDIRARIDHEAAMKDIPRVAPDIDDEPEGL